MPSVSERRTRAIWPSAMGADAVDASTSMSHRLLIHHTSPSKIPATTHVIVLAVEQAKKADIAPAAVLAGARLRAEELSLPSVVLNREQELRVFTNLQTLSADDSIGLEIGQRVHVSGFGLPGYTMLVSENIEAAVGCMHDFPLLMGLYHTVRIEKGVSLTSVVIDHYAYAFELEVMATDMCLSAIKTVVVDLLGELVSAVKVSVRYAEPSPALINKHRLFFGCEVAYGAERNSISFPSAVFEACSPLANSVSFQALFAQCTEMERQWACKASDDCLVQIRALMERDLIQYSSLARVSERLCVTERTLRRRLEHQGSSFQHLLDQVRHERACTMFADPGRSISSIAQALGYSDAVSFRHAFRRWTGLAPSEYRARLTGH